MKTYYYYPNVYDNESPDIKYAVEFKSDRDINAVDGDYDEWELSWMVEDMAKDYINSYGFEVTESWCDTEQTFAVWDENKTLIGEFAVLLEFEPAVTARRKDYENSKIALHLELKSC